MERARGWVTCAVVLLMTGCTALTGADDLTVDRATDTSQTTPGGGDRSSAKSPPSSTESTNSDASAGSSPGQGGGGTQTTLDGVACGTTTCGGATPKCCAHADGASTCISADGACADGFVFGCSGAGDCADGMVCCFVSDQGKPFGECRKTSACTLPSTVLCANNSDCPSGACTGKISGFDEYGVCSPY